MMIASDDSDSDSSASFNPIQSNPTLKVDDDGDGDSGELQQWG